MEGNANFGKRESEILDSEILGERRRRRCFERADGIKEREREREEGVGYQTVGTPRNAWIPFASLNR